MGWAMVITFLAVSGLSYMGALQFLLMSEATFFNLLLLTGDMWPVLFGHCQTDVSTAPLFCGLGLGSEWSHPL
jgi:hypothetical protein